MTEKVTEVMLLIFELSDKCEDDQERYSFLKEVWKLVGELLRGRKWDLP